MCPTCSKKDQRGKEKLRAVEARSRSSNMYLVGVTEERVRMEEWEKRINT